ncbi:MAG: deoxynucleoside kinase [Bacteroidota bacterium]
MTVNHPLRYDYLVIEGNIGTGKTSLATRLAQEVGSKLVLERFADNPFLPKFYENQARYAFPLELSFLADRFQQLNDELRPRELFTRNTVADYILSKSLVFAQVTLKEDEFQLYHRLFHIIHAQLPKPDLLVYLHKDVSRLQQNIRKRGRDYEQNISDDYLVNIERGYWDYFRQLSGQRILVIDTNDVDFVNSEEDYKWVRSLLDKDYPIGLNRISRHPDAITT